jgi:hypothetical protein
MWNRATIWAQMAPSIGLAPVGQTGHLQIVERMRDAGLRLSGPCFFSAARIRRSDRAEAALNLTVETVRSVRGCMKPIPPDGLGNSREESNAGSLSQSAGAREIDPYISIQVPSASCR